MCRSTGEINASADKMLELISDYNTRAGWDPNFMEGSKIMDIGEGVELHYMKTKKVAVVSSRD